MLSTISRPYAIAGQTIAETATSTYATLSSFAISTYKTLTSEKAQCIYKDAYVITSVVIQVTALALYAAGLYTIIAGRKFRAYYEAEWATAESASAAVTEPTIADADETQAVPAAVQKILDSSCKTTKKLREIATHFNIPWRNARGEGKHMLNAEIKAALKDYPEILAALS
jgi:hypothetical protein